MGKANWYWHLDAETQVNHLYYRGVSLCERMAYGGPDRHEYIGADEAACAGCIAEARARRSRLLRQETQGGGNGKSGTD